MVLWGYRLEKHLLRTEHALCESKDNRVSEFRPVLPDGAAL